MGRSHGSLGGTCEHKGSKEVEYLHKLTLFVP